MKGISAGTFYINYELNVQVLKQTIARAITGVEPRHIRVTKVNQCTSDGPCVESDHNDFGDSAPREGLDNKLLVTYSVEAPSPDTEYALFSRLLVSTSGSEFDEWLHEFAKKGAAVDLYKVDTGPSVIMKTTRYRPRRLRATESELEALMTSTESGSSYQRAHEATRISFEKVLIVALFAVVSFFGHAALLHRKSDVSQLAHPQCIV
jgi:hypothetical protein